MKQLNPEHKNFLWDLLGVKPNFNAYGWMETPDLKISKNDYWSGWFNDCYNFVNIFPKTEHGLELLEKISRAYYNFGWNLGKLVNKGLGLTFSTMTKEEVDAKAHNNLVHGGRMSD